MCSQPEIARTLGAAEQQCLAQGKRLTTQRQQVLTLMLEAGVPLTAYQLLDRLKVTYVPSAQPPTIYRALEFLVDAGLVHRLDSNSTYVVCDHLECTHVHEVPQFLVCDDCGNVKEAALGAEVLAAIHQRALGLGFHVGERSLEIHGRCGRCQAAL